MASITETQFGKLPLGQPISLFTLVNANGLVCRVMNYGACLTELHLPDRHGRVSDVVLGYSSLEAYLSSDGYVGATIGRVANRIAGGQFCLNGKSYRLSNNDGINHLHGGVRGFDKAVWNTTSLLRNANPQLIFSHLSPEAEEGYPGTVSATVSYTFTGKDELLIDYQATTNKPTPLNLTNHTYFNLAGQGNILNHQLQLDASRYTPLDCFHIPTGVITATKGSAADFTLPASIGKQQAAMECANGGFNHNYILNAGGRRIAFAARLHDPESGRALELWTDQPCIQLYTGAYLRSVPVGKYGQSYAPNSGVCLEPQRYPDAVNHPHFPSIILQPGQVYQHRTIWKFWVE